LNVIDQPLPTYIARSSVSIDSKIKQLQAELQYKVQTFDNTRREHQHNCEQQQTRIKQLVQQFDPLDVESRSDLLSSSSELTCRHPSIEVTIPSNHVHQILEKLQPIVDVNTHVNVRTNVEHSSASSINNTDLIDLN
jgi:hypothetical protein